MAPVGLAASVSFGSPGVVTSVSVAPSGLAVTVAFGYPGVSSQSTVQPSGLAVGVALGAPAVQPGPVSIVASGLATAVQWGAPTITSTTNMTIAPVGWVAGVVFGDALAYNDQAVRKPSTQGVRVVRFNPWPPPRGAWWFNGDR